MQNRTNQRRNFSNKETLARLMAREGIDVVYDNNQKTASFDMKNRVLTLPVMMGEAEYVFDWFIAHEVSHALYTPADDNFYKQITDKALAGYYNVTEDARIEKLIKLKYPGTKKDCRKFYEHFTTPEVDFFKIKDKNIDEMKLIDRINLHFKIGHIVPINFTDEEQEYVEMVDYAMTAEEALEAAKKILERDRQNQQPSSGESQGQKKKPKVKIKMPGKAPSGLSEDHADEEDTGVMVEYEEPADDSSGDSSKDGDVEESDQSLSDEESSDNSSEDQDEDDDENDDEDDETITIDLTEPETQKAFNDAMENMFGKNPQTNIINPDNNSKSVTNIIKDMEAKSQILHKNISTINRFTKYAQLMKSGKPIINTLVSYFNMKKKASEYQKIQQSKSGSIDLDKLSEYRFNDDIFLRNDVVMEAKNHGLFFLLDYSGSMSINIEDTFKQLTLLVEFCRLSGIPYEVYGFTSGNTRILPDNINLKNMMASTSGVELVKLLDSSMNKRTHMQMCEHILMGGNVIGMRGTPICGAIVACEELVKKFQNKTNCEKTVFCILTDGGTDDTITSTGNNGHNSIIINNARKRYPINHSTDAWKVLTAYMKDSCRLHSTVGFYLCNSSDFYHNGAYSNFLGGSPKARGYAQIMKSQGFIETDEVIGYDKYFFITTALLSKHLGSMAKDSFKGLSAMANDEEASEAFLENISNRSLKNLTFLKVFIEQIS